MTLAARTLLLTTPGVPVTEGRSLVVFGSHAHPVEDAIGVPTADLTLDAEALAETVQRMTESGGLLAKLRELHADLRALYRRSQAAEYTDTDDVWQTVNAALTSLAAALPVVQNARIEAATIGTTFEEADALRAVLA